MWSKKLKNQGFFNFSGVQISKNSKTWIILLEIRFFDGYSSKNMFSMILTFLGEGGGAKTWKIEDFSIFHELWQIITKAYKSSWNPIFPMYFGQKHCFWAFWTILGGRGVLKHEKSTILICSIEIRFSMCIEFAECPVRDGLRSLKSKITPPGSVPIFFALRPIDHNGKQCQIGAWGFFDLKHPLGVWVRKDTSLGIPSPLLYLPAPHVRGDEFALSLWVISLIQLSQPCGLPSH